MVTSTLLVGESNCIQNTKKLNKTLITNEHFRRTINKNVRTKDTPYATNQWMAAAAALSVFLVIGN